MVHGDEAQLPAQFPEEQEQAPLEQLVLERGMPVPGSGTAGPPLGVPPPTVPLDPPHETMERTRKDKIGPGLPKVEVSFTGKYPSTCPGRQIRASTPGDANPAPG